MARILIVHGISNEFSGESELLAAWASGSLRRFESYRLFTDSSNLRMFLSLLR